VATLLQRSPRHGYASSEKGLLANHLASTDNLTRRTTNRQNTFQRKL